MLDGIKLQSSGEYAKNFYLKLKSILEFKTKIIIDTGEIEVIKTINAKRNELNATNTHVARYKELLTFTFKETIITNLNTQEQRESFNIEILGSLHKLHYNGNNDNDFTFNDFENLVNYLVKTFGINPLNFKVVNLEFGTNIIIPIAASDFINQIVIYKTKKPDISTFGDKGSMKRFVFSQYEVKIYDKGLQTNTCKNKLRIEIKINKSQSLIFAKIDTLFDLLKIEVWNELGARLNKVFSDLLIYEDITHKLNPKENLFYIKCKNVNFWIEEKKKKDGFKNTRNKFRYLNKKNNCNLQDTVTKIIKKKCEYLFNN